MTNWFKYNGEDNFCYSDVVVLMNLTLNRWYLLKFSYLSVNGETKRSCVRLYLYNQNLFIN